MEDKKIIHIGSIIKKVFNERSMTIVDFAEKIKLSRSTIYNIFERKRIDIELLREISKALDYDFVNKVYFPENPNPQSSKVFIAFEIEECELDKLNLSKDVLYLVKKS